MNRMQLASNPEIELRPHPTFVVITYLNDWAGALVPHALLQEL